MSFNSKPLLVSLKGILLDLLFYLFIILFIILQQERIPEPNDKSVRLIAQNIEESKLKF